MSAELVALRKLIAHTCDEIHGRTDHDDDPPLTARVDDMAAEEVAAAILAAGWVRLPEIRTTDDTGYWRKLPAWNLANAIQCDLWNGAAGLHEQRCRAAKLADDAAVFSYREATS